MREINQEELSFAEKLVARSGRRRESRAILLETMKAGRATIAYQREGFWTKSIIKTQNNLYIGVAKRSPEDKSNPIVGYNIAFSRALRSKPISL